MDLKQPVEKKKYPVWFYSFFILIPLLFFLLLEAGLRLFDYGEKWEVFTGFNAYPGVLYANPNLTRRYFPELENTPKPVLDGFEKEKGSSTYRIFVLGESSAAGWPFIANVSFPRQLKRNLELLYPDKNIEVVNLGISAICTYTIRDILPQVLNQKPDVILIYTGHNEYYGALGAGSTQTMGKSRFITNLVLSLQEYRVVQLIQNIVRAVIGNGKKAAGGSETLMAKVIGESTIPVDSDTYLAGLKQFDGNMRDILGMCQKAGVPVVIGNLTCNLRSLKPFMPVPGKTAADEIFKAASAELSKGNNTGALRLFREARDLDGLRFRAPEAINNNISQLAREFNCVFVNVDSLINVNSENGIAGNDLIVDHLHPGIKGHELISDAFLRALTEAHLLPGQPVKMSQQELKSRLAEEFPFTALDSAIANLKISVLTGAYPFVEKGKPAFSLSQYVARNLIDSIALSFANGAITFEEAHYKLADHYMAVKNDLQFEKELAVLIADRPNKAVHYEKLIHGLIECQQYKRALKYLMKLDKFRSDEFSTKFIGTVSVGLGDYETGKKYLQKYVDIKPDDPQAWYNLSGACAQTGDVEKALSAVKQALRLAPRYAEANLFYRQLAKAAGHN